MTRRNNDRDQYGSYVSAYGGPVSTTTTTISMTPRETPMHHDGRDMSNDDTSSPVVMLTSAEQLKIIQEQFAYTVVYVSATWCMPCVELQPEYLALATQLQPYDICLVKENVDDEIYHTVNAVPTFFVYDGQSLVAKTNDFSEVRQLLTQPLGQ
jgi:thiol-disulfide isomerase/thioredoxin